MIRVLGAEPALTGALTAGDSGTVTTVTRPPDYVPNGYTAVCLTGSSIDSETIKLIKRSDLTSHVIYGLRDSETIMSVRQMLY